MQSTSSEAPGRRFASDACVLSAPVNRTAAAVVLAAMESLRPHQWLKNLLVFVPLAAAHRIADLGLLLPAMRAFAAFSLCASAVYLANDLHDIAADQAHPHKRFRAIASGRLPQWLAMTLLPVLVGAAAIVAWPLGLWFRIVLVLYLSLMVVYTWKLKTIILLDAFALATGYALRVIAGSIAVAINPSARLLAFCIFLFFSLALIKRYTELTLLETHAGQHGTGARGYGLEDRAFILILGIACGALSVLVLAVYMSSGAIEQTYSRSQLIWLTCVLLLYWISHMWLMANRGRMTDDPLVFAVKDRVSLMLIALMGASAWLAV